MLRSAKVLDKLTADSNDEKVGIDIMRDACQQPLRWLATNSEWMPDGWSGKLPIRQSQISVFDALSLDFGSMLKRNY